MSIRFSRIEWSTELPALNWINYHHLLYFWTVAREGSISRASETLRLAQPTISGQIRALEISLGVKLFQKAGRRLEMTEMGQLVFRYADEIFHLGRELTEVVQGRPAGKPIRLMVGIADAVPKLAAFRILHPVIQLAESVHMICHEDRTERLLGDLFNRNLDIVLTDAPIAGSVPVKAFDHLLGSCPVGVYGEKALVEKYGPGFPQSLDHAPILLPLSTSPLRRGIQHWFEKAGLKPRVVAEFQDSALSKVFGQAGAGLFFAPTVIEAEITRYYDVQRLGLADGVEESFYVVTIERRIKHPAVVAIAEAARNQLFGTNR